MEIKNVTLYLYFWTYGKIKMQTKSITLYLYSWITIDFKVRIEYSTWEALKSHMEFKKPFLNLVELVVGSFKSQINPLEEWKVGVTRLTSQ